MANKGCNANMQSLHCEYLMSRIQLLCSRRESAALLRVLKRKNAELAAECELLHQLNGRHFMRLQLLGASLESSSHGVHSGTASVREAEEEPEPRS